jgi:4-hydroxy-4-methyl-2-oxoglutarate aldolase
MIQDNNLLHLLRKLAEFDTPTICNAIEMFGLRSRREGYMGDCIRAAFPDLPPMVGFASTATLRSEMGSDGAGPLIGFEQQLKHIESLKGPAVMVYQDLDVPSVGATVGDVMCNVYQAFGAVGLITSGAARDLAQVHARRFPLFLGTTICSHAYCRTVEVGSSVQVGGLTVRPGDLLHGDANGVTIIPLEIVSELPDVASEYVRAERRVLDYAQSKAPKCVSEMLDRRRAMGEEIAALQRRVSSRYTTRARS